MLNTFKLKNGVNVATYNMPSMRSVFLSMGVKGGSIFDTPETSGRAHFMEHILVQAIPSFPNVEALSDFIESLAGSYNAMTYSQSIHFQASIPSPHLEDILKIGSEVFFSPLFIEEDIERERGSILEEIRQKQDSVWYKNNRFWADIRFKEGHPLRLSGGGSIEAVKKLNREDLMQFWKEFFFPENTYIVIVGNFNEKGLKGWLDEYFNVESSNKSFSGFPPFTNDYFSDKLAAIRCDKELKSCYLDLSFPSITGESSFQERITQSVISYILGGLRSSRLFRLLRQRRGLVYDVGFTSSTYETFGYAEVYSQCSPEKLDEVISLIISEVSSFIKSGPLDEEIEFAKNYYVNRVLMYFDHPSGISSWIESDLMWEKEIMLPEEYVKFIQEIDRDTVVEFIKKNWDISRTNLVIQGPIKDSKENKDKFGKMLEDLV